MSPYQPGILRWCNSDVGVCAGARHVQVELASIPHRVTMGSWRIGCHLLFPQCEGSRRALSLALDDSTHSMWTHVSLFVPAARRACERWSAGGQQRGAALTVLWYTHSRVRRASGV